MNGKNKCKILKEIRRQIAQENDIEFVTAECKYQGDCSGTCPKCESELRYLEQELEKRQKAGKAIAVAGIAAALMVGSTGCSLESLFSTSTAGVPAEPLTEPSIEQPMGFLSPSEQTEDTVPNDIGGVPVIPETSEPELQGEPAVIEPTNEIPNSGLMGVIVNTEPSDPELMGDIAIWP